MDVKLKITLVNEAGDEFMGIGLVWLLREIDATRSIHSAAERVGLSYVKALKILNRLEANLPAPVIIRARGGSERGGAELTDFGRKFLREYDELQRRIKKSAAREYASFKRKVKSE